MVGVISGNITFLNVPKCVTRLLLLLSECSVLGNAKVTTSLAVQIVLPILVHCTVQCTSSSVHVPGILNTYSI